LRQAARAIEARLRAALHPPETIRTSTTAPVRRHLKGCERCRTFRGELRKANRALAAVYPANIHMALHPEQFPKIPRLALYARLPVQLLFALMTWRGTL
jgi:hypothetical protein